METFQGYLAWAASNTQNQAALEPCHPWDLGGISRHELAKKIIMTKKKVNSIQIQHVRYYEQCQHRSNSV